MDKTRASEACCVSVHKGFSGGSIFSSGDGFYYRLKDKRDSKWRLDCIRVWCKANAVMLDADNLDKRRIEIRKKHSCEPDMNFPAVMEIRSRILERCKTELTPYRVIFNEELSKSDVTAEVAAAFSYKKMESNMCKIRRRSRYPIPPNPPMDKIPKYQQSDEFNQILDFQQTAQNRFYLAGIQQADFFLSDDRQDFAKLTTPNILQVSCIEVANHIKNTDTKLSATVSHEEISVKPRSSSVTRNELNSTLVNNAARSYYGNQLYRSTEDIRVEKDLIDTSVNNQGDHKTSKNDSVNCVSHIENHSSLQNNFPQRERLQDSPIQTDETENDLITLKNIVSTLEKVTDKLSAATFGDSYEQFGRYIASVLRGLPLSRVLTLKRKIINDVFSENVALQEEKLRSEVIVDRCKEKPPRHKAKSLKRLSESAQPSDSGKIETNHRNGQIDVGLSLINTTGPPSRSIPSIISSDNINNHFLEVENACRKKRAVQKTAGNEAHRELTGENTATSNVSLQLNQRNLIFDNPVNSSEANGTIQKSSLDPRQSDKEVEVKLEQHTYPNETLCILVDGGIKLEADSYEELNECIEPSEMNERGIKLENVSYEEQNEHTTSIKRNAGEIKVETVSYEELSITDVQTDFTGSTTSGCPDQSTLHSVYPNLTYSSKTAFTVDTHQKQSSGKRALSRNNRNECPQQSSIKRCKHIYERCS